MPDKRFTFQIGADPEFTLSAQNSEVDAQAAINRLFTRDKKTSREAKGYKISCVGEIGHDGNPTTGEFRPLPSNSPHILVLRLRKLLELLFSKCKILDVLTIGKYASIGGHLHFDIPVNGEFITYSLPESPDNPLMIQGMSIIKKHVDALHKAMASFYLPLQMGDNCIDLRARIRKGYGFFHDYRIDKRHNKFVYEFRLPNAEWLTTPKIAESTLAYMGVVYDELANNRSYNDYKRFKNIIIRTNSQGFALQELLVKGLTGYQEAILNTVRKHIRTFRMYPQFKQEIEYILNPKQALKDKIKAEYNMIKGWGYKENKRPNKKSLLKLAEPISAPNPDALITFPFNDDENVNKFTRALQNRAIKLNWKLKHNYFFFGLKAEYGEYHIAAIADKETFQLLAGQEIIKSKKIWETMQKTLDRMLDACSGGENAILVGIPHCNREKLRIKPFMELIYNIERGKLTPQKVDVDNLPDIVPCPADAVVPLARGDIDIINCRAQNNEFTDAEAELARESAETGISQAETGISQSVTTRHLMPI